MISKRYKQVRRVVESEFSDILEAAELIRGTAGRIRKLRLHLIDNTFPKHCHDGEQNNVTASFLPDELRVMPMRRMP